MKIQHLRFLTAVVEHGGVSRAAERLHRSQPTLSAGLKALEQELGRPLFDRSAGAPRSLRLTPSGHRFYRSALEILKQCDAARSELLEQTGETHQIRMGVLNTLPQTLIVKMLDTLVTAEPKLRINFWEGSAERVSGWLAQERVDIIWANVNDLMPHARALWREPLLAVVAPRHPLAKLNGGCSIRDLQRYPFVHRSHCELDALGRAQLKMAAVKLQVIVRAEREDFAFNLVRNGKAITLAPKSLVPPDLISKEVSGLNISRSIGLQWHENFDPVLLARVSDAAKEIVSIVASPDKAQKNSKKKPLIKQR